MPMKIVNHKLYILPSGAGGYEGLCLWRLSAIYYIFFGQNS